MGNLMMKFKVEEIHLASRIGSGTLDVLGTPALIGFMEKTASSYAKTLVSQEKTTVGTKIEMEHLKPSKLDDEIEIEIFPENINDKTMFFKITAYCHSEIVGKASHTRAVIDILKFKEKNNLF
ncbi:MAG TPA: diaminopimelate epimerase [Spirochaetia bacterium]|nr:MAG: hypothetical protein A2Y41_14310 [Spirochaetes bacterium GWB1_36_13]HCL56233.1 diaminopimelate epimerase [Spirochaetia bacterium]